MALTAGRPRDHDHPQVITGCTDRRLIEHLAAAIGVAACRLIKLAQVAHKVTKKSRHSLVGSLHYKV